MSACLIPALSVLPTPTDTAPPTVTNGEQDGLFHILSTVPDPRSRRGTRYPLAGLLTVAVCAVLAGASSFTAIVDWLHDLDDTTRARLGFGRHIPATTTMWRLLTRLDADQLATILARWLHTRTQPPATPHRPRHRRVITIDGKTMRAARQPDGSQVRLERIQRLLQRGRLENLPWPPHDEKPLAESVGFLASWGVLVPDGSSELAEPKVGWMSRAISFLAESSMVLASLEFEAIRQAVRLGQAQVTPAHLLLAVMALEDQVSSTRVRFAGRRSAMVNAPVLSQFGMTMREARPVVRDGIAEPSVGVQRRRAWRTNPRNPSWGISAARIADEARMDSTGLGSGALHLVAGRELLGVVGADPAQVLDEA